MASAVQDVMFLFLCTALAAEGSVDAYAARAVERHPAVKADFYRWQASVKRIAASRALPQPTLQFGVFVRSVETRVGPQQARVSLAQAFPWPTKLVAESKAASSAADAAAQVLEATTLTVVRDVELAYWNLWEVRELRALHTEHLEVLQGLSSTVASRMETGMATLADLQQVDLSRARLEDRIGTMDATERKAEARLQALVGPAASWPSNAMPDLARLSESLESVVLSHPRLTALDAWGDAAEAATRSKRSDRLPGFTVGADWVVTGPAVQPGVPDSGKDAVMVGAGVKIPLWQRSLGRAEGAARSEVSALREDERAAQERVLALLEETLADLEDSERRARTVTDTLLPQAEAAYGSLLGNYAVGQSTVAQVLLAQRDLLDLSVDGRSALADHQRAWAELDQLAGAEVRRTPLPQDSP